MPCDMAGVAGRGQVSVGVDEFLGILHRDRVAHPD